MSVGSLLLLLAAAGFVAAMAMLALLTAFFRVTGLARNGLLEPEAQGSALRRALAHPRRYIVGLGICYLLGTVLAAAALTQAAFRQWPEADPLRLNLGAALALAALWTLAGAAVKNLAAREPVDTMRLLGPPSIPAQWLLTPWSALVVRGESGDEDTAWSAETMPHLSTGEIRQLMQDDDDVNLEEEEREMIRSIFGFHETMVREIMVPRIDMISLDAGQTVGEALRTVVECRHSRIPLHEGGVDRVTGLLYAKDLLSLVESDGGLARSRTLGELARPAYFIPESKKLDEVLDEFRGNRIHMAVVIDEYGGTAGLVTLEDVLEEIVGEIEDEFDEEESLYEWLDERSLRVDPKIDLEDLQEVLGVELPVDEGSETLAGLVYEAAGKVPAKGDAVEIAGMSVVVDEVADQRILQVRLTATEPLPGARRQNGEGGS